MVKTILKSLKNTKKYPRGYKIDDPLGHFLAGNNGFWFVLTLFVSFSLSGCGFHLKGMNQSLDTNYQTVKLEQAHLADVLVQASVRRQFEAMDVRLVNSLADADLVLSFSETQFTTSITGRTGQGDVSSQLLKMSQPFEVTNVATDKVVLRATVISFRDHVVNTGLLQASTRELRMIKRQMSADIALKMLTQINFSMSPKKTE